MSVTKLRFAWPDRSQISRGAFGIVKKLRKAGFEAFIAGGAVRDALLKRPIQEIDIATSAKPVDVKKLFKKTIPTGEKHGTVTVFPLPLSLPRGEGKQKRKFLPPGGGGKVGGYEVTTFRVEGPYEKYRRPSKVKFVRSAEEDAKRRDFTVNAMFYDPDKKEVIDFVDGIADLSHKRIRFIGDPEARIREDALRLLRAVRFATTLEFDLAKETRKAIQKNAKLITKISAERIKQELDRIIMSPRAGIGIGLLDIVGLLQYVLPEFKNCQGVGQPRNQHSEGDVYAHSLLALEKADESYDLPTRYAVLFHDLGKPQTRQIRSGKITFYGHQKAGGELARKIGRRLKFSAQDSKKISWLVEGHMVPNDFARMRLSTRRRWGLESYFSELLQVHLADVKASIPAVVGRPAFSAYRQGLKILEEIKRMPELGRPLLSGNEVMKMLKIKEGPLVGRVLKLIQEEHLAGKLKNKQDALKFLRQKKRFLLDKNLSTL